MTKKLQRKIDFVFEEDGQMRNDIRPRARFDGAAVLTIDYGQIRNEGGGFVCLLTDHNYTKEALDELIAELLFLKQEWEQHPVYLEQEQAEDMDEIAEEEEWVDEAADFDLEENQPNPFEERVRVDLADIHEQLRHAREAMRRG